MGYAGPWQRSCDTKATIVARRGWEQQRRWRKDECPLQAVCGHWARAGGWNWRYVGVIRMAEVSTARCVRLFVSVVWSGNSPSLLSGCRLPFATEASYPATSSLHTSHLHEATLCFSIRRPISKTTATCRSETAASVLPVLLHK